MLKLLDHYHSLFLENAINAVSDVIEADFSCLGVYGCYGESTTSLLFCQIHCTSYHIKQVTRISLRLLVEKELKYFH